MMLTLGKLKAMKPGAMFAFGTVKDAPGFCNMAGTGKEVPWVAVRGDVPDWAVYAQNPYYIESKDPLVVHVGYAGFWPFEKVRREGDKVHTRANVEACVGPVTEDAWAAYRH